MKYFLTLLLVVAFATKATIPVDGMWWNPDESGRGLMIETQNGTTIATFYSYDENRIGRWYLGAGTLDVESGIFQGQWNAYDGGQCSGCSYSSPSVNESESKGAFTITFLTDRKAVMNWDGGNMNLERLMFGYSDAYSYLYGVWTTSMFYSYTSSESSLSLTSLYEADGNTYVRGTKWASSNNVLASVLEVNDKGQTVYSMLIDSSTSFYRLYIFTLNKNKFTGLGWLYRKTGSPSGDGTLTLGAKFLESTGTSSTNKVSKRYFDLEAVNNKIFKDQNVVGKFNTSYLSKIEGMEAILENQ